MTTAHSQAMQRPTAEERHLVLLIQAAHDLIEEGYGEDPDLRVGVLHVLSGLRVLADGPVGRLDPRLIKQFVEDSLHQIGERR